MATFIHRARDPVGEDFVYWFASELDLDGSNYVGPPAFGTLEDITFIRVVPSEGAPFTAEVGIGYDLEIGAGFILGVEAHTSNPISGEVGQGYDLEVGPGFILGPEAHTSNPISGEVGIGYDTPIAP